jgi:hypothetical protein
MTQAKEISDLQERIARAQSECDVWRTAGRQELHLEAYTRVEALELQLDWLRARKPAADEGLTAQPVAIEIPDDAQRELMGSLAISFRDGMYHLGEYRYERLADAVAYARLRRVQGATSAGGLLAGRVNEGVAPELALPRFLDREEPHSGHVRPLQEMDRRQE